MSAVRARLSPVFLMRVRRNYVLAALVAATSVLPSAQAADERFFKESPGSMNGFAAVSNASYAKECSACHFAYLPGLLPARSWTLLFSNMDKHFGEVLNLGERLRTELAGYAAENAADRSPYEGSKGLLEKLPDSSTPLRVTTLPALAGKHSIARAVVASGGRKGLKDCKECHLRADKGSFGTVELSIPGRW